ncbi:hypothetical protein DFP72DRAFT_1081919 [Ephemerocybe angulata]|uniref:Uncharacterized protein n=1 Tax=Ephemerocybe angulata TaxID=980116 RepID=A0A8H6H9L6_9AGAR|nr:hypothetical protein DFP72DRAFT_1081919 [Tulosesus angulatus]
MSLSPEEVSESTIVALAGVPDEYILLGFCTSYVYHYILSLAEEVKPYNLIAKSDADLI